VTARVIVTGATGFAGSHLLDLLAAGGADLWAFARSAPPDSPAVPSTRSRISWHAVELLDRVQVQTLISDIRPTRIFHCAGAAHVATSWNDSVTPLEVNVLGTHHLLDAVERAGLSCRVFVPGSATVYRPSDRPLSEDDPIAATSPYGLSKLAQEMLAERAVADDEQQVFIARAFNHVGPRQNPSFAASSFAMQIARIEAQLAPPFIEVGNLEARRDVTDVRDTVRAYQLITERGVPGRVYNVCSGHAPSMRELLDRLLALTRTNVTIRQDPTRLRPADNLLLVGNRERIERELGWTPQIPLAKTLADLLEYWRGELKVGQGRRPD
jgi:GDP-4-dehydro-6-deoxy-D-mannose reductase